MSTVAVPRYPIYRFELWWPMTGARGKRTIDCSGSMAMFRELPTRDELEARGLSLWEHYRAKAADHGKPVIEWHLSHYETWCLGRDTRTLAPQPGNAVQLLSPQPRPVREHLHRRRRQPNVALDRA